MAEPMYFQWQNEVLLNTIYPMREHKLRDFLVYYAEIDIWAEYKGRDIASLQNEVQIYKKAQTNAAVTAFKTYSTMRSYFFRPDARMDYLNLRPINEVELAEINKLHDTFINYWPKDVRGERDFVTAQIAVWEQHRNGIVEWIKSKKRRLEAMAPDHEKRAAETQELQQQENVALPMAEQELKQLRAFASTYDKIEKRKLEWYQLQKKGQVTISEAEFLVQTPDQPFTVKDIVLGKIEEYKAVLEKKTHLELLEEVVQRFLKQPERFPLWLQYMVIHFSGMRYASAHGSWADPKDLLIRLRSPKIEKDLKLADDAAVEKLCKDKVAAYEGSSKPKLAQAQEKEWKDKVALNLINLKSPGPGTRRFGLKSMLTDEMAYEIKSMTTAQALDALLSMKATFPQWAWKEIIRLTPLRVTQVTDPGWEKLTPQEEMERNSQQNNDLRMIMDAWENYDISAWREEHGRTHELIVSRAVCNETAEHIQHLRGHLPPGGLTPKPKWYLANETENKLPGSPRPYYVKPAAEKDYTVGASILWLRFVNKLPNDWQIAKPLETKAKEGLIPNQFMNRKVGNQTTNTWVYKQGEVITRSRIVVNEKKQKVKEEQWLRWIHEATVVEVAETVEGQVVLTYETALPEDNVGTSSIGFFKHYLSDIVSIGKEDEFFGSFVGFVPEGQVPINDLKEMLNWNKILRRNVS